MKSKILYAVIGLQWNGYAYEPINQYHGEELEKVRSKFESIQLHADLPMVTLREYVLKTRDGVKWEVSKSTVLNERIR